MSPIKKKGFQKSVVGTSLSDLSLSGFSHFKEVFNEHKRNPDQRTAHTALFPQDHRQNHLCGSCPLQRELKGNDGRQNQALAS